MKRKSGLYVSLFLLVLFGCSRDELYPDQYGIQGTWRLYEQGGSPGFGYYVTSVPQKPLQGLTFTSKGELHREGERLNGLFEAPYYRVDSLKGVLRIAFLAKKKDDSQYYAGLFIRNDTMRITPVCYEGCHYGFVRVQ